MEKVLEAEESSNEGRFGGRGERALAGQREITSCLLVLSSCQPLMSRKHQGMSFEMPGLLIKHLDRHVSKTHRNADYAAYHVVASVD